MSDTTQKAGIVSDCQSRTRPRLGGLATWLAVGTITSVIAYAGVAIGHFVIKSGEASGFVKALAYIDGNNYRHIVENGYSYQDKAPSSVAFFPAYPLATRWVSQLSGLAPVSSQVIISNVCCLIAFALMGAYLQRREVLLEVSAQRGPISRETHSEKTYALLAMGLLPSTFFFRMGYTESMFLCLAILTLYLIATDASALLIALVVGLGTAVRPVGVAFVLPLAWYVWKHAESRWAGIRKLAVVLPLACWG